MSAMMITIYVLAGIGALCMAFSAATTIAGLLRYRRDVRRRLRGSSQWYAAE